MKYDVLHNFISPVTGRILADVEDYILVGDKQGIAIPSPILIDMRLDFINLRRDYDYLRNASIIIGFPNLQLPKAQVLSNLEDGILVTTKGILSTTTNILTELPDLTKNYIWLGDENNRPQEVAKILLSNLPNLTEDFLFIGDEDNRPIIVKQIKIDNLPPLNATQIQIGIFSYGVREMWQGTNDGTVVASYSVSTSLAQIDYAFITTNWIIGSPGLTGTVSYPNAQFISQLPSGRMLTHIANGVIGVANLTYNSLWIGNINNQPQEIIILPLNNMANLDYNKIWIGNIVNRPVAVDNIPIEMMANLTYNYLWIGNIFNKPVEVLQISSINLPDLSYNAVWRGDITGRPTESQSLTNLEIKILELEAQIDDLFIQVGELEIQVTNLQADVVFIGEAVTGLLATVTFIQGEIFIIDIILAAHGSDISSLKSRVSQLEEDVDNLNIRIDNLTVTLTGDITGTGLLNGPPIVTTLTLTLDQIKLAQNDVDLNDQKIINLKADNVEANDAINAKFLWDLMHDEVDILWQ